MFNFLKKAFSGLLSQPESEEQAAVSEAIEMVVEATNPKIRLLSNYKTNLRPSVKQALGYANAQLAQIPGPVEFNRKAFAMNPLVHAVFGSADSMQRAFSLNRPLVEFFARPENVNVTECFALLGMEKREKRVLGSEMKGDIMVREVQQVVVSFENHQLLAPSRSEQELRNQLQNRVLDHLGGCALGNIEALRSQKNELEEQYRRLQVKLNMVQKRRQGFEALVKSGNSEEQQVQHLQQQLTETGKEFQETSDRIGTLDDQIAYIGRVLSQPQEYFQVLPASMKLDKMGIRVKDESTEPADKIELAEVQLGKSLHVFGVAVRYPRSEMIPREAYLTEARAYLDFWS